MTIKTIAKPAGISKKILIDRILYSKGRDSSVGRKNVLEILKELNLKHYAFAKNPKIVKVFLLDAVLSRLYLKHELWYSIKPSLTNLLSVLVIKQSFYTGTNGYSV